MQKAIKELKMRRKDQTSTKKVPIDGVIARLSINPYKKTSGSIPISIIPKTIYLNSGELIRPKSKVKIEPSRCQPKSIVSLTHTRKTSVNNSRKESIDHQQRKNSKDFAVLHNRSNSSLNRKEPYQLRNTFRIDMSNLVDKDEFPMSNARIGKHQFNYHYVIGKGGFGKVWSVEFKKNHKIYAMKEMMKTKIIGKKSINSVMNERLLLSTLKHPFIVNMNYAFQDRQYLYLVMDLLNGGDLRYHMGRKRKFKEVEARFYIGCIIVGLEYLHLNSIIHRDIKPENLVLDEKGYLRITDLGIARYMKPNNSADTSGTPGYMAPEVMCRQDHSFPVDYYALGVIAYQFMMRKRPYVGKNRKEIRDQILAKQVQVKEEQLPEGWSPAAADFVNKMIQRKSNNRLGYNSINEIKDHPWFKGFSWVKLLRKEIQSPFIPKPISENYDYRQQISQSSQDEMDAENQLLLRRKSVQELFEGYSFEGKAVDNPAATKLSSTTYTYNSDEKDTKTKSKKNNYLANAIV